MPEARIPPYALKARVSNITEVRNYNFDLLNIPEAWKLSKGKGVRVAVLDTGRPQHDDLVIKGSWSAVPGYEDDLNGHGTHVAGLLGARENGKGVVGIAPECAINNYTVLGASGSGSINGIVEAIYRAMEDDCHIINMSLGISSFTIQALEQACKEAANKGIIIVSAAGNESGVVNQPAAYDCVIAVSAVDKDRQRASFSNFGPELDFAVGGVDIYSTYLDNGYAKMSGTSMACPVFAGLCAVILGQHMAREEAGDNVNTPINGVQDMIEHIKRFAFDVGPDGFDEKYGNGIPIFQAPNEAPTITDKGFILSKLEAMGQQLDDIRQAVEDL